MKDVAQRIINAETGFINDITDQFGFTHTEAMHIFDVYRKERIIKLQAGIGRYTLSHGAFWDKAVMERALSL